MDIPSLAARNFSFAAQARARAYAAGSTAFVTAALNRNFLLVASGQRDDGRSVDSPGSGSARNHGAPCRASAEASLNRDVNGFNARAYRPAAFRHRLSPSAHCAATQSV